MTVEPSPLPRNRYFGRCILCFAGAVMVRLADGRRCSASAREVTESGVEFKPGERVEVSIFATADGALSAFDLMLVD